MIILQNLGRYLAKASFPKLPHEREVLQVFSPLYAFPARDLPQDSDVFCCFSFHADLWKERIKTQNDVRQDAVDCRYLIIGN